MESVGRRLGQHFLKSESALRRTAEAACPDSGQLEPLVIEIGPGRGALTQHLVTRCQRLIVIEVDPPLAAHIREKFPAVEVVEASVLDVDLGQWGPAVIAGNLPYYITSPIIEQTLQAPFLRAVFLVQKEVAVRLTAASGSRDYGYLSVATQSQAKVDYCFTVPAKAFAPPPKVDSAVVRLSPGGVREPEFLKFASACFRQKRKMLRNNLAEGYPAIADAPEATLRAEQLTVPQLQALWRRLVS
ncbi:MAG: 16S rRNA (adenine(1518)-N(6)/adenine(1519)-N(6))-dimethyltransferase RsmA [Acidobacteria bacterium]|nr:16S rRNA (adenine(1518)-N(6)/adenine(1519)-N(6))-dimethyltransferase RsmA [Acidobacteriota bacterium]